MDGCILKKLTSFNRAPPAPTINRCIFYNKDFFNIFNILKEN